MIYDNENWEELPWNCLIRRHGWKGCWARILRRQGEQILPDGWTCMVFFSSLEHCQTKKKGKTEEKEKKKKKRPGLFLQCMRSHWQVHKILCVEKNIWVYLVTCICIVLFVCIWLYWNTKCNAYNHCCIHDCSVRNVTLCPRMHCCTSN